MKGVGTDDNSVIRIIVSRCEIDLVQIQEEFFNMTNQQLEDYIAVSKVEYLQKHDKNK